MVWTKNVAKLRTGSNAKGRRKKRVYGKRIAHQEVELIPSLKKTTLEEKHG